MINYVEFSLNSKRLAFAYLLELAIADICFGFENQNTRALHIYKVNMLFSVLNFCLILMPNFSKIMTVWSCFVKHRI